MRQGQIRIWFCKDRCGQNFGAGNLGKPMGLLLFCTTAQDQLSGDFRTRPE